MMALLKASMEKSCMLKAEGRFHKFDVDYEPSQVGWIDSHPSLRSFHLEDNPPPHRSSILFYSIPIHILMIHAVPWS